MGSASPSHIPTALTWVSSASRTPGSFHAGWQKLTHLERTSISSPPDLCSQGCTKTRTLLLAYSYLWQEHPLSLLDPCFTTAVKNQHTPPMLPGHKLLQQAFHTWGWVQQLSVPWTASGISNRVKKHTSYFQPLTVEVFSKQKLMAHIACCLHVASSELQEMIAWQTTDSSSTAGSIPNPQNMQC